MKINHKHLNLLLLLLGTNISIHQAQARMHFFFDDSLDWDIFDEMHDHVRKMRKHTFWGPSKEEQEAIKIARENLAKIKANVTENDNNIVITFDLNGANKNAIDIEVKEYAKPQRGHIFKMQNILKGIIPTDHGKVEFYVTKNSLEIARHIEIKKEHKDDKKQTFAHFGSSATEIMELPQSVQISKQSAKAQTKDNTLTITLAKKKEAKLAQKQDSKLIIAHN